MKSCKEAIGYHLVNENYTFFIYNAIKCTILWAYKALGRPTIGIQASIQRFVSSMKTILMCSGSTAPWFPLCPSPHGVVVCVAILSLQMNFLHFVAKKKLTVASTTTTLIMALLRKGCPGFEEHHQAVDNFFFAEDF